MLEHAAPVLLEALQMPLSPKRLRRIPALGPASLAKFPEKLLQELIHAEPGILPVEELDRGFMGLRPVCRELPLASGSKYVDNLLINPDGRVCIVECKLWRNPEAVREVVAQILDYAAELSRLSYSQLESAVGNASGNPKPPQLLIHNVLGEDAPEGQKVSFIDAVSQSLRTGRFLLLIAGDGIRPGLQQIADLLNRSPLGFSLGLVEMAFYAFAENGPYYVQPRILLRTETVTRTVFILADTSGKLDIEGVSEPTKAQTISEQDFLQKLAKVDPTYPSAVLELIDAAKAVGCSPELLKTYVIYAEGAGQSINLGHINSDGTVTIWGSASRDGQIGQPLGLTYMKTVVSLLPTADIKDSFADRGNWYVRFNGRSSIPLSELLVRRADWIAAMAEVVRSLRQTNP